ncbi:uncharacterized protein L969DRAFT_42752 [Mixia osmundae IAM 14324]|uniref:Uncharacterized protein n=1 Tax=Mixia osmundae (strain CBS 9802 / IAM 14324 / JCM 22182 / KY 12970) TaxID=764103 RepID=G7DT33_MIXOS|nr:uncharacterized protein L969DRAFT_42752 [Mixia osmundae IAM 14324]KEI42755.1 hypothetical protein L969DRAFT_42752 [Mixia osmundae IAM 14324]GAA93912.1 hypothetical protein E5Q_00558 [Mixia osmundae IAM 14324]
MDGQQSFVAGDLDSYKSIIQGVRQRRSQYFDDAAANLSPCRKSYDNSAASSPEQSRFRHDLSSKRASWVEGLERDLVLSAQVGQALLTEQRELQESLRQAQAAKDQLTEKLALLEQQNAGLAQRLQATVDDLDSAEMAARSTALTLAEERTRNVKLQADNVKLSANEKRLAGALRDAQDMRQELANETNRADAAESRARRALERLGDLSSRSAASLPPQVIAPAKRVRNATVPVNNTPDMSDLSTFVGELANENELLRASVAELKLHLRAKADDSQSQSLTLDETHGSLLSQILPPDSPPVRARPSYQRMSPKLARRRSALEICSAAPAEMTLFPSDVSTSTELSQSTSSVRPPPHGRASAISKSEELSRSSSFSDQETACDRQHLLNGRDMRTASLPLLTEHVSKLLARLRVADVASLEQRLARQHLPGDVSRLAVSTMRDILTEIEGLRGHFRRVVEGEQASLAVLDEHASLVGRRDFVNLVKLLRDTLFEVSRLRALLNRIILEPALAKKLKDLDVSSAAEDAIALSTTEPASSGGMLAPLARYLPYVGLSSGREEDKPPLRKQDSHSRVPVRQASKLSSCAAVASATVNVEFGAKGENAVASAGADYDVPASLSQATARKGDIFGIFAGGRTQNEIKGALRAPVAVARAPLAPVSANVPARILRRRGFSDSSIRSTFMSETPADKLMLSTASRQMADGLKAVEAAAKPATLGVGPSGEAVRQLTRMKSYSDMSVKPTLPRDAPPPMPTRAIPIVASSAIDTNVGFLTSLASWAGQSPTGKLDHEEGKAFVAPQARRTRHAME